MGQTLPVRTLKKSGEKGEKKSKAAEKKGEKKGGAVEPDLTGLGSNPFSP